MERRPPRRPRGRSAPPRSRTRRAVDLAGGSPERTRSLLTDALTVLAELPAQAEPLPVFTSRVLNGHSHAAVPGRVHHRHRSRPVVHAVENPSVLARRASVHPVGPTARPAASSASSRTRAPPPRRRWW
ncbi:TIGR02679 domain-containing protein [Streptomyces shenzhenensis]|uniref:TIGR02679 domain-containing protein n=1 Tax=Streptomyces shenzhenensis TaxID=943815 RepID=UPI003D8BA6E6